MFLIHSFLPGRSMAFLLLSLLLVSANSTRLYADTRISTASGGNWSSAGTWKGGTVPLPGDKIIIATTGLGKVVIDSSASCAGITIQPGATLECAEAGLTVGGAWQNNGNFLKGTATIFFAGSSAAIRNGSGINEFNHLAVAPGTTLLISEPVTVSGTFSLPAAAAHTRVLLSVTGALEVGGEVVMGRPASGFTNTISVGDGRFAAGALVMQTANNGGKDSLTIRNGSVTIAGNLQHDAVNNFVRFYGSGTLAIGGATGAATIGFTAGRGTVRFNGEGRQQAWAVSYHNLTLGGSGIKKIAGCRVEGILSLQGTATAEGTPVYSANSTLDYRGAAAQQTGDEFPGLLPGSGSIFINNAAGVTLTAPKQIGNRTLTIGNLVPNSQFNDGGYQLTSAGILSMVSGVFRLGSSQSATAFPLFSTQRLAPGTTVIYDAGVEQPVSVQPVYQHLQFSGAGKKIPAAGMLTVRGNWSVSGGGALLSIHHTNALVTGDMIGNADIVMGSGTLQLQGNWLHTGPFNAGNSTVSYNKTTGGQQVRGMAYNKLTLGNRSGMQHAMGDIAVVTFHSVTGGSFDMGIHRLSATNISHAGTLLTQNTSSSPIPDARIWGGTVHYSSASHQTIVPGHYRNLNGSGGPRTLGTTGVIGIAGVFTTGNGEYITKESTVDFNGIGPQDIPAIVFGNLRVSKGGDKKILGNIMVGRPAKPTPVKTPEPKKNQNQGKQ